VDEPGVQGFGMVLFYILLISLGSIAAIYAYFNSVKKQEEKQ